MLDRQHLEILVEVVRQGSVTAAAAKLNQTQSGVSHAMRKLEDRYGVPLWQKDGRGVRLTQAGDYVLKLAERVLPQFQLADLALADFSEGKRGQLRIGMECHPCLKWLLKVVDPYLVANDGVDIDIRNAFRFGALEALLNHEIDMMITPDPVERVGVSFFRVFDYRLVLAVAESHSLGQRERVEPADLATEVLFTYPVSPDRLDIFTRFMNPAGIQPKRHRTVEATEIMLSMVAAGRGVSAIPDWLLEEERHGRPIRGLAFGDEGLDMAIYLGVRDPDIAIPYVASFIEAARSQKV